VPTAEQAAEDDEFAEVVGGVVGDEERFAKKVLTFAPAEGLGEIGVWFGDESFKGFAVFADGGDAGIPGAGGGWLGRFGPVVVRPLDGVVAAGGWRGEVEDVALGDTEVLEKLPGGVGQAVGDFAAKVGREILDCVVEGGVGLATFEEGEKLGADFYGFLFRNDWLSGHGITPARLDAVGRVQDLRAMITVSGGKVAIKLPRFFDRETKLAKFGGMLGSLALETGVQVSVDEDEQFLSEGSQFTFGGSRLQQAAGYAVEGCEYDGGDNQGIFR
jgi:hypothetical protein